MAMLSYPYSRKGLPYVQMDLPSVLPIFFSIHQLSGQVPDRLTNTVALWYLHKIGINSAASCTFPPREGEDVIVLHLGKAVKTCNRRFFHHKL